MPGKTDIESESLEEQGASMESKADIVTASMIRLRTVVRRLLLFLVLIAPDCICRAFFRAARRRFDFPFADSVRETGFRYLYPWQ